jgi:DNA polymerase I-like protein with 3'-5' exonuclease and polymerase domains
MLLHDRVYPEFLTHTQANGRWSIVNPALQQLPGDLADIFIPDEGYVWLKHDWDAVELRIQGAIANDKPLLDVFAHRWDPHTLNMCEVLGYPYPTDRRNPHASVDDAEWRTKLDWRGKDDLRRRFAKVFCFRLIYRGDPRFAGDIPGARTLGLDGTKLKQAADRWLQPHHAIRAYWARQDEQIRKYGFTQTWTGRKRRYMSIGPDRVIPAGVFREGANHPIQGGVSDLKNLSLLEILERCPWTSIAKEQHDAFWVACPVEREAETWPIYQEVVQRPRTIEGVVVPFPAEFKRYLSDGTVEKVKHVV